MPFLISIVHSKMTIYKKGTGVRMRKSTVLVLILLILGGCKYMSNPKKPLTQYHKKRDFNHTSEPRGSTTSKRKKDRQLFVVQKHAASHLHFDLRLEDRDVLLSWAVPKGPSLNPQEKRLAIQTEDHPLDYAHFEGIIPQGEYGGGTVMVWDIGTFELIQKDPKKPITLTKALAQGHADFILYGKRLQGTFSLIHAKNFDPNHWLLIKKDDEFTSTKNIVRAYTRSALSNRTMAQITKDETKKGHHE